MRLGSGSGLALAAALICLAPQTLAEAPAPVPARVVSMNLCTDQLAMLLAAPGQLLSVSHLASDPMASAMADQAGAYVMNRGQAEQIFLMDPDLVLAGTYTALPTVALLRRLGVRVVQVPPVTSLDGVAEQIRALGEILGRKAEGARMAAEFEAGVADLRISGEPVRAVMYYPNGYTTGSGTLADDILRLTGFANVGAEAGISGGGTLPLERLVMADPQMIVTSHPYPAASRSEEILSHPALRAMQAGTSVAVMSDADWICGTPYLLRAVAQMHEARAAVSGTDGTAADGTGG